MSFAQITCCAGCLDLFLRAKAGTAVARLSYRNFVCLSVIRVD